MDDDSMPPSRNSPLAFFTTPCQEMGIDALARVTSQIVAEVQALVGGTTPLPGTKYVDQLQSLHAAFGQGRAVIGGLLNASASIHRLPPELLTKIFSLYPRAIVHGNEESELAYWPFKAEADVGDLHGLMKVCRYWRDLAIATPMLWTTVRLGSRESFPGFDDFRSNVHPSNSSPIRLIVHLDHDRSCTPEIVESVLRSVPIIRELHIWHLAYIQNATSLRSVDANALEHCTLWGNAEFIYTWPPRRPSTTNSTPFLFNNGAARLRSLCLSDFNFQIIPATGFPALTLLLLNAPVHSRSWVTMGDLFKFLAGCPRLEELYIYNIQRDPFHATPVLPPPIPLPRLQYLYYTYSRHRRAGSVWEEGTDPIEHLLSSTSIPSTCHIYLTVSDGDGRSTDINRDIVHSVCRHVQGKDAVSHVFLWLIGRGQSSLQLVFSDRGSLRLQFKTQFACVDFLYLFGSLLSGTEDVRVRYTSTGQYATTEIVSKLAVSLPEVFPRLKALSLIRRRNPTDLSPSDSDSERTIHLLHPYLATKPRTPSGTPPDGSKHNRNPPEHHAELGALWVYVGRQKEIAVLQRTLAVRAALGFPIRCVIVHHCFAAGSTDLAQLRALGRDRDGMVEELILTDTRASDELREEDWAVRLPDKFSLPAAIRRDWPTVWYRDDRWREDYY